MITQILISSYDRINAQAAAYINAMTVQPTAARKAVINTTFNILDSGDLLNGDLGVLYLTASHDAQAARLNAVNPIAGQSMLLAGSPNFTADQGYLSLNTSNFMYTPMNMNTIPNVAQNSVHLGTWCTSSATNDIGDTGLNPVNNTTWRNIGYSATEGASACLNNVGGRVYSGTTAVTTGIGHLISSRTQAADFKIYKNGIDVSNFSTGSLTSSAIPANYLLIGIQQNGVGGRRIGAVHIGAGLSAAKAAVLHTAIKYYMDNL